MTATIVLWFAFNFVLTIFDLQHTFIQYTKQGSCDLLSTLFLLSLTYNKIDNHTIGTAVVICFQLCSYYLWLTTNGLTNNEILELWFAFNFVLTIFDLQRYMDVSVNVEVVICFQLCSYYLWLTTSRPIGRNRACCDLLSTLFLLSLTYNRSWLKPLPINVVICFQLCSYYLWLTTGSGCTY